MRNYSKAIAVGYLLSVAILLLLEFSQFQKLDRLRNQIFQSHQMISGRDEGIRLELEFRRLRSKLNAYVLEGSDGHDASDRKAMSHADMMVWFDIFWSRVFSIKLTGNNQSYDHTVQLQDLITSLQHVLKKIDPKVQALQSGDFKTFRMIDEQLSRYDKDISRLASHISQSRLERASVLQQRLDDALQSMDTMFATSAFGVVLLLTLFGTEAYRARKEAVKTKGRAERVRFLAEHDTLTGLGNRACLNEKMELYIKQADDTGDAFNLLLLDLDKFKDVNDTFGHPMGDRLLKKAAARLLRIFCSPGDIVARLGGDEFAILMRGDLDKIQVASEQAIKALSSVFELGGHDIRISTSIGISRYPDLSTSANELLRDADLALYEAKNQGRKTYAVYEPAMSVVLQNRMRLEADLRRALQDGGTGLEVYYQPQINFGLEPIGADEDYQITGVEALVRWFHPTQGQIPTLDFIEIAENSGLIGSLSDWIFREACEDMVALHRAGFMLNLSVNLSPLQLNNPNLPTELLTHLRLCGFDPHYLTLEITESADVEDTKAAAKLLSELAEHGISLAMDDFGTGYSNLGYLKSLPLHTLKIDRTFVMQIEEKEEDRKLVRGVINLAQGMGLKVVAEGVETPDQVAFLRSEKCDAGQGYLFGRPMHKLSLLTVLNEQRERAREVQKTVVNF